MEYFYGISHLAGPLAKRLGFFVTDWGSETDRRLYGWAGKTIARLVAGGNEEWRKMKDNFGPPRMAVISRKDLISGFGGDEMGDK